MAPAKPHIYAMKSYLKHITIDPLIANGLPCIRGIPVLVSDVVKRIADGVPIPQILADHRQLTLEDIKACVAYTSDLPTGKYLY